MAEPTTISLWEQFLSVLTYVASAVSIISAIVAIVQARRAKKIKEEVVESRFRDQLFEVMRRGDQARLEARKIETPARGVPLRGVDVNGVAATLSEFISHTENIIYKFESEEVKTLLAQMRGELSNFKAATEDQLKCTSGDKIAHCLDKILSIAHQEYERRL